ncbi:hypothetical protein PSH76_13550 [Pseudomonas sp. FP215]|uniref:hypothetical protein n=1 Tax=Pseudomonas sp. FP215 TaxID=2738126 RepID=UPI002733AE1A|nr:hypothetical protein [Pseudomonas sp. FP215]WLH26792.1 hypothetical protein PSH76_13550 [Pseudomonas sp. FP215]
MKKIVCLFLLFASMSFFYSASAIASNAKFSCFYDVDPRAYMGQDMCKDHGFIYSTPEEAAEALAKEKKAYWKSVWGNKFYSFSSQFPECIKLSQPHYAYSCTYNAQESHLDNNGDMVYSGFITHYEVVTAQHSCQPSTVLKGSVGTVITSETDGKRYVLSQSPGETVCAASCNYSVRTTEKCYLSIGSDNEGFCNYHYDIKLVDGLESSCATDPSLKLAEIGDELQDKCPEGYEFANGSRQCSLIPCIEGFERLPGSESCSLIPTQPGGGTGGGSGGDGGTGGGTGGDGGTGGGTGGDGGTGGGTGGDGDTGGGTGGDGGTGGGTGGGDGGDFSTPGPLNLDAATAGKGDQVKAQFASMHNKFVSSDAFIAAKNGFGGSSHTSAVCPIATVQLFGKDIVFDSHCTLFEIIRPILASIFLALWSFVAIRIVLSA